MFGSFPPSPLVGLRLQSLLGPGSRHCYGIITLIDPGQPSMSVNAFHEKASRSQVGCCVFRWTRFYLPAELATVAMLPFALSRSDSFARCRLGVLVSAGAAICLAPCGSALAEWNLGQAINAVTGTRLWAFVFSLPGTILFLGGCGHGRSAAVVQRFVHFSAHP